MKVLKEVANISGQSGLYKILKPTRNGVIVESLDAAKIRKVAGSNERISVLGDISVYLTDHQESSMPLSEIFLAFREKHGLSIAIQTKKASDTELFTLLEEVAPDFDKERVYASDVKKIISWYNIVSQYLPEAFEEQPEEVSATEV